MSGTALVLDANEDLRRLEERMVAATRPFRLTPEDAEDFIMTPDGSRMDDDMIEMIDRFVPDGAGVNYPAAHLRRRLLRPTPPSALPISRSTRSPSGRWAPRSIRLVRRGVAERVLWNWTGEIGAR